MPGIAIIWVASGVFGVIGAIYVGGRLIWRERWGSSHDAVGLGDALENKAEEMGHEPKHERAEGHPTEWPGGVLNTRNAHDWARSIINEQ